MCFFPPFPLSPRWPSGWQAGEDPCPSALLTKLGKALTWAALSSLSTPEEPCVPSRWDHLAHFKLKWVGGLQAR